jgi:DNA-binding MarR family transcriptional regulator
VVKFVSVGSEDLDPAIDAPAGAPAKRRPPFGQAVGFLLSQLGFETSRRFGGLMNDVGLEPRHFAVLRAIESMEGSAQNTVGDHLRIPASSMVGIVDHLEQLHLVERRLHLTDRRSRTLHLTPHGKNVLDRAVEVAMGFESTLNAGLTAAQRQELIALLSRVADNLELTAGLHPANSSEEDGPPWPGKASP